MSKGMGKHQHDGVSGKGGGGLRGRKYFHCQVCTGWAWASSNPTTCRWCSTPFTAHAYAVDNTPRTAHIEPVKGGKGKNKGGQKGTA